MVLNNGATSYILVFSSMKSKSALLITLLLLTGCYAQSANTPKEDIGYNLVLLEQINLYRMGKKLNQLRFDAILTQLAQKHSLTMFQKQKTSHLKFAERFRQVDSLLCVENVGWNYSSPQSLFEDWRRSSDHNQNMLKKELNMVGIAEVGKYVTFFACN